jgi:hypothetical protein
VVERSIVEKQRGDVIEDDSRLGEVGDVLDVAREFRGATSRAFAGRGSTAVIFFENVIDFS